MKRGKIKIKAVRRKEPDVRLYVLALIELARQQQAEEEAAARRTCEPRTSEEDDHA